MRQRGFALIAVLWVVVALSALAAGAVERARADAAATGGNVARMRARWAAEACLAVTQSRIEEAMRSGRVLAVPPVDTLYFANGARCATQGHDPNARFQPDSAGQARTALFDSLLSTLGADQVLRDTLVTDYGSGRINVNAAPPVVLATLPGFGPETLRLVETARAWRRPLAGLDELTARLSPAERGMLLEHYATLMSLTSFRTGALVLDAQGWTASSDRVVTVLVLVVDGGSRAAIVRRRML